MEKEKVIKISLKKAIIIAIFVIAIIALIVYLLINKYKEKNTISKQTVENKNHSEIEIPSEEINSEEISKIIGVDNKEYNNYKDYFTGKNVSFNDNDSPKLSYFNINSSDIENFKQESKNNFKLLETYILNNDKEISDLLYSKLKDKNSYIKTHYSEVIDNLNSSDISEDFLINFYAYVCSGMIKHYCNYQNYEIKIERIEKGYFTNNITVYMVINNKYYVLFEYGASECYFSYYEGTEYKIDNEFIVFDHIGSYDSILSWHSIKNNSVTDKPVIYLYPEKEIKVNVKLGNKDKITCSYPKYEDTGWNVIANPDGILTDTNTGRQLYCLYWEGINTNKFNMNEGFVVKREDTAKFLEEKLSILGLTNREAEEFIIYWLPRLEANEYNYIKFATLDEINENMTLEITPKPDTTIRILMFFKGLDNPINIKEQELTTPERNGFVAIEWGGTEIN